MAEVIVTCPPPHAGSMADRTIGQERLAPDGASRSGAALEREHAELQHRIEGGRPPLLRSRVPGAVVRSA